MEAVHPYEFRLSTAEVTPRASVVTITGEVDMSNADRLDGELARLSDGGNDHTIVDLLEVPFIDSTILAVLLRHSRALRADGGRLTIVTDDIRVLRTFEIAGLMPQFAFVRTLGEVV